MEFRSVYIPTTLKVFVVVVLAALVGVVYFKHQYDRVRRGMYNDISIATPVSPDTDSNVISNPSRTSYQALGS